MEKVKTTTLVNLNGSRIDNKLRRQSSCVDDRVVVTGLEASQRVVFAIVNQKHGF